MSSETSETDLAQTIGFTFAVAHALDIVSDHPLGLTFTVIHALGLSSDVVHSRIYVDNKSDDGSDDESVCSTESECAHCNEVECEDEYV